MNPTLDLCHKAVPINSNCSRPIAQGRAINLKIIILGAGQLGSRYLQGLATIDDSFYIEVVDPSPSALSLADVRWKEASGNSALSQVNYVDSVSDMYEIFDLAIVATTADVRSKAIEALSIRKTVRYWIIEKVLAQSREQLAQIERFTRNSEGRWVNTPRRAMKWYKEIKRHSDLPMAVSASFTGRNWNIASNSIHFIDTMEWLTNEKLVSLAVDGLENWFVSGRAGFYEAYGEIVARFSSGSHLSLVSKKLPGEEEGSFRFCRDGERLLCIDERAGIAELGCGQKIFGRISFQSEITSDIVDQILSHGTSDLPPLLEVIETHERVISSLQYAWQMHHNVGGGYVPIT